MHDEAMMRWRSERRPASSIHRSIASSIGACCHAMPWHACMGPGSGATLHRMHAAGMRGHANATHAIPSTMLCTVHITYVLLRVCLPAARAHAKRTTTQVAVAGHARLPCALYCVTYLRVHTDVVSSSIWLIDRRATQPRAFAVYTGTEADEMIASGAGTGRWRACGARPGALDWTYVATHSLAKFGAI